METEWQQKYKNYPFLNSEFPVSGVSYAITKIVLVFMRLES